MIHLVLALECEAQPLVKHFKLEKEQQSRLFKHYANNDASVSLTITGTGRLNAAAAVTETHLLYPEKQQSWLNIGVAGRVSHKVGEGFIIGKLQGPNNNQIWYPQILFDSTFDIAECVTLDQPSDDYCDRLYDMEAAGFYEMASRVSIHELIHCIKIVSDNQENLTNKIKKAFVSELIRNKLNGIEICITALQDLQNELSDNRNRDLFNILTTQWHFTTYQKYQLQQILERWYVLAYNEDPSDILNDNDDAGQAINKMNQYLDDRPVDYNNE